MEAAGHGCCEQGRVHMEGARLRSVSGIGLASLA